MRFGVIGFHADDCAAVAGHVKDHVFGPIDQVSLDQGAELEGAAGLPGLKGDVIDKEDVFPAMVADC